MSRTIALLSSAILAVPAALLATTAMAQASVSAPAPYCESGDIAAHLDCYIVSPPPAGTVVTWTLKGNGTTRTFTGGSFTGYKVCAAGLNYSGTYTYTLNGVNYASLAGITNCVPY